MSIKFDKVDISGMNITQFYQLLSYINHLNTDYLEHGASGFILTTRFAESLIATRQSSFV